MHPRLNPFCDSPNIRITTVAALFLMACLFAMTAISGAPPAGGSARNTENICGGWRFHLGDVQNGQAPSFDDSGWRLLDLPHDWSIEGEFNKDNPSGVSGGALPGGTGWYLSFRNSGYTGTEYYVILGDPNAPRFTDRLIVKVVQQF